MPLTFDNRISWMDIGTLLTTGVIVSAIFFGLQGDQRVTHKMAERNQSDIQGVRAEVVEVQRKADQGMSDLARQVERNRLEQKSDNRRLEAKIDKVLERVVQ